MTNTITKGNTKRMTKIETISLVRDVMNQKNLNSKSSTQVGVTSEFRAKWLVDNDVELDKRHDMLPRDVDADLSIAYLLYKINLMDKQSSDAIKRARLRDQAKIHMYARECL